MGEIRKENLHQSLIEYLDGLGLNEEQVNEIVENALVEINEKNVEQDEVVNGLVDKVGELNGLMTGEKGDLVGAINELFQSANNGKELIASAIGEPVSADDTFSAMSNDINGLLSTFKTNMMNNGITVESSDRFKQLIDKISTMVEEGNGKGIQYAEGTFNITIINNYDYDIVIDTNLDFNPTLLFLTCDVNVICSNIHNSQNNMVYFGGNTSAVYIYSFDSSSIILRGMTYKDAHNVSRTGTWYAIGVGEEDTTLRDSLASILTEEGVNVTEEDDMASLISKVDEEFTAKENEISGLEVELSNRSVIKTGTLNSSSGKLGEYNNRSLTITHNLGSIPSYIICRTSGTDYLPDGGSVGRGSSGPLCITSTTSTNMVANGNRVTLTITDITETTFKVVTTMPTSGLFSSYIAEWWVMA